MVSSKLRTSARACSDSKALSIHSITVNAWGVQLLKDVSLNVNAGEIVSIIGPNGSGKTSLLNAVLGDFPGDSQLITGQIFLGDTALDQLAAEQRACSIAVLPQMSLLNFPFTVEEVIALGRTPHASGSAEDHNMIEQVAGQLDIRHLWDRLYTHLSGGEKQRVHLARVMVQIWRQENDRPRLLLLDEPMSALDIGHQQQVMRAIRAFADTGVAVLAVMHDINLAAQYSNKILALKDGKPLAYGSAKEVLVTETLRALYGVSVTVIQSPQTGEPVVLLN